MGSMSASDPAPLPRLGEVFFDVRGESRTLRLSWYADTGIAVFSIWQGGTCTGTFRLPIADLPRMVEALRRGPQGEVEPGPPADADLRPEGRSPRPSGQVREEEIATGQTAVTHLGHPEGDPLAGGYPARQAADSAGPDQRTGRYPGAAYQDQPTGVYPPTAPRSQTAAPRRGRPGTDDAGTHPPQAPAGLPGGGYPDEHPGDFREAGSGPYRDGGYPDEHPGEFREAGSGPYRDGGYPDEPVARPYVALPEEHAADWDEGGGEWEDRGGEWDEAEPRLRGRRHKAPEPESFPYGPPPGADVPRQGGRNPRRH